MEEHHSPPDSASEARQQSSDALRALGDRARAALARQRDRMGDLEAQLTSQLETMSAALSEGLQDASENQQAADQLRALREEFATAQQSWEAERGDLEQELQQREQSLNEQQETLTRQREELESREQHLQQRQQELEQRCQECDERERASEQQQEGLAATQQQLDQRERDLAGRQEQIDQREHNLAEGDEAAASQLADLQAELAATKEKAAQEQDELQQSYTELENTSSQKEAAWNDQRAALEAERDQLSEALQAASARSEKAEQASEERDELNHKFELALADVQRMREHTSELEHELARRPEAEDGDSVELVHLRGERDTLAERVETLEKQLAERSECASDQDLADVQRRFELAVEDLRQLKIENAELHARLDATGAQDAALGGAESHDWESQKRRLLASLADEGEPVEEKRQQERTSIEDAVRMTDQVVAQKDREIYELQAQLAGAQAAWSEQGESAEDEAREELLSNDEIIQQHRAKAAELERELHDKLREAEMEMSVQRAKIAREQTELAQWRSELESLSAAVNPSANGDNDNSQPKRRWLSKLGLGDDDK